MKQYLTDKLLNRFANDENKAGVRPGRMYGPCSANDRYLPEGQAVQSNSDITAAGKQRNTIMWINTWKLLSTSQESGEEVLL
jgi:hypothetical protein